MHSIFTPPMLFLRKPPTDKQYRINNHRFLISTWESRMTFIKLTIVNKTINMDREHILTAR